MTDDEYYYGDRIKKFSDISRLNKWLKKTYDDEIIEKITPLYTGNKKIIYIVQYQHKNPAYIRQASADELW